MPDIPRAGIDLREVILLAVHDRRRVENAVLEAEEFPLDVLIPPDEHIGRQVESVRVAQRCKIGETNCRRGGQACRRASADTRPDEAAEVTMLGIETLQRGNGPSRIVAPVCFGLERILHIEAHFPLELSAA